MSEERDGFQRLAMVKEADEAPIKDLVRSARASCAEPNSVDAVLAEIERRLDPDLTRRLIRHALYPFVCDEIDPI